MNLDEAIRIVSNFQRNSGMEIDNTPIQIDASFVQLIIKHLKLSGKRIRVVDISSANKVLYGYFRNRGSEIEIGIVESLNSCWTRYVTCKELSHILLGYKGEGVTGDPRKLVSGLYSSYLFGSDEALDHENLANICAAEIMMPYEISQTLLENKKEITAIDIAHKFKIPLAIVQVYRNDELLATRKELYESLKK